MLMAWKNFENCDVRAERDVEGIFSSFALLFPLISGFGTLIACLWISLVDLACHCMDNCVVKSVKHTASKSGLITVA